MLVDTYEDDRIKSLSSMKLQIETKEIRISIPVSVTSSFRWMPCLREGIRVLVQEPVIVDLTLDVGCLVHVFPSLLSNFLSSEACGFRPLP